MEEQTNQPNQPNVSQSWTGIGQQPDSFGIEVFKKEEPKPETKENLGVYWTFGELESIKNKADEK